ncbi:MAG: cytochrome c3 family protein [Desulfatibacillum sp.]|nr:cytochrome c3 family protein [Desulfatibacillum sp.]
MAALFLVGAVCYAAFPPGEPIRVLLDFGGGAGKIMFEHQEHHADFDLACLDCHHTAEDETDEMQKCGACHLAKPSKDSEVPSRKDSFHAQCIGCHEDMGLELECTDCHGN